MRFLAQLGEAERRDQLLERAVGILIERPHSLRGVDGGTATHGDDPVRLKLAHGRGALHNGGDGGVRLDVLEELHFHTGLFQIADCLVQETEAAHAAAADDDHRLLALQVLQFCKSTFSVIQITRQSKTSHNCYLLKYRARMRAISIDKQYVPERISPLVKILTFYFPFG